MLGVIAIVLTVLPQLAAGRPLPAPLWVLSLASLAQSAVLLAVAVWAGVAFAPALGLRAPVFESILTGRQAAPALRSQLMPAIAGGIIGGTMLVAVGRYAPDALAAAGEGFSVPLVVRILYGGITEELLLRWGLMTVLVWLAWKFLQRRKGVPQVAYVWLAIGVSALLFGAGHLPAAAALVEQLTANVVAFVVGANAVFGLLFGYLFWRHGLESAMIAHAGAHVVGYIATLP